MYFHCYLLNLVPLKSVALISCQSIPLSRAPPKKLYFFGVLYFFVLFWRCRWLELFEMVSVFFPQFQLHELTVFLIRPVIVLFNRIILLFKSMSNSHSDPGASFFVNGCILIGNRSFICSILNWLISTSNTPIKKLKQQ